METWKLIFCVVLVALTTAGFALDDDDELPQNTSLTYAAQTQRSAVTRKGAARYTSNDDVCAVRCGWWSCTTYYCKDGVCCSPGDPESTCCPHHLPECVPGIGKCCKSGYYPCGGGCCSPLTYCCDGACCINQCCSGKCCSDESVCCRHDDSSQCCNRYISACCEGLGCVQSCGAPFDALGCELIGQAFPEVPEIDGESEIGEESSRAIRAYGDKLYRILRPDENPEGIVAKDPSAQKTVSSHVNCGGRANYPGSQYISTSNSLDVSRKYKTKGEERGRTGLRICEFDVNLLRQRDCIFVDLTDEELRNTLLKNWRAKNFARAYAEVLIQCPEPVPCRVVDPPPED